MFKSAIGNVMSLENLPRRRGRFSPQESAGVLTRWWQASQRIFIVFLLGPALLSLWPAFGGAAQLPNLPQAFIDTTYSPPSGNTIAVNAGGNLQTAINNAQPGDTIVLQAGATFTGPFSLPNKTSGSGWIYIRSSAYASLPAPGTRVSIADAANMPKITVSANNGSAIGTSAGAHHYRFVGIEFKPVTNNYVFNLISIGNGETSLADLPHDITFDRCYIHGDPTAGGRRGVAMNGISVAVIDSYVSDFKEDGADTQALCAWSTPGPLKMVNNYLEAAGENFLSGGADPAIANVVPSDIEIRRNYFFKPLAWISQPWSVKNLIEFKNGQRILVEGNIFENNWPKAQNGFGILITPRNQSGGAPWSVTQDITFRLNRIINVGQGFNLSGRDAPNPSQITRRVLIENNVIDVTGLLGADGRIYQVTNGPIDTTIRHNTAFTVPGGTAGVSENNPSADQFDFRDNIVAKGGYGFIGTGTGEGIETLNAYYTHYTFLKNAIIGPASTNYPAGNFFPANIAAVGFVNFAAANYRLSASSPFKNAATDAKDLGADIDLLDAATACVLDGQCGTPPLPDTTPPVISAVTASAVTASSAVIVWATNEAADSQMEYGPTTAYGSSTALNPALVTAHSQSLSGLSASTLYHYRVKSKDAAGNLATSGDSTFTTPSPSDTSPPVISSVAASAVTASGAAIVWATNEAADSQIEYGPTTAYGSSTALNPALVTAHSQSLSGLSASTLYHYRVKSKDAAGNLATSGDSTFTTASRSPYGGAAFPVPGRLEAENFDTGGEGISYHDLIPGNQGGAYRPDEDVDISTPSPGVYVVNNFQTGEWLEYTLSVALGGDFLVAELVSTEFTSSRFHVEIDGIDRTGSISVPSTGSWSTFQWVGASTVSLTAGQHVMRIVADQEYFNIDAIRFDAAVDATAPTVAITSPAADSSVSGVIQLVATAWDNIGVAGVRFFLDGSALGAEILTPPYVLSWDTAGVANGPHTITAIARDVAGNRTTSAPVSLLVASRSPYGGAAFPVPGRLEAENFDTGGEGISYHDLTSGNQGGAYRPDEDVDIITTSPGVYVVNNFQTGEWLEYTLSVALDGDFLIEERVSSEFTSSRFHVEIDGIDRTGSISVPSTGSWKTFQWVGASTISLTAGQHVMRIVVEQEYFNIDSIRFRQP